MVFWGSFKFRIYLLLRRSCITLQIFPLTFLFLVFLFVRLKEILYIFVGQQQWASSQLLIQYQQWIYTSKKRKLGRDSGLWEGGFVWFCCLNLQSCFLTRLSSGSQRKSRIICSEGSPAPSHLNFSSILQLLSLRLFLLWYALTDLMSLPCTFKLTISSLHYKT